MPCEYKLLSMVRIRKNYFSITFSVICDVITHYTFHDVMIYEKRNEQRTMNDSQPCNTVHKMPLTYEAWSNESKHFITEESDLLSHWFHLVQITNIVYNVLVDCRWW